MLNIFPVYLLQITVFLCCFFNYLSIKYLLGIVRNKILNNYRNDKLTIKKRNREFAYAC